MLFLADDFSLIFIKNSLSWDLKRFHLTIFQYWSGFRVVSRSQLIQLMNLISFRNISADLEVLLFISWLILLDFIGIAVDQWNRILITEIKVVFGESGLLKRMVFGFNCPEVNVLVYDGSGRLRLFDFVDWLKLGLYLLGHKRSWDFSLVVGFLVLNGYFIFPWRSFNFGSFFFWYRSQRMITTVWAFS